MKIIKKIKNWFWWRYIATEEEKLIADKFICGFSIGKMSNGKLKRINPRNFIVDPLTFKDNPPIGE